MKVSENWLRSWIDPEAGIEEIAEQLTMAGLEVKSLERLAPQFSGVLVGLVKEVSRHPDADTLSVCLVDAGQDALAANCLWSAQRQGWSQLSGGADRRPLTGRGEDPGHETAWSTVKRDAVFGG